MAMQNYLRAGCFGVALGLITAGPAAAANSWSTGAPIPVAVQAPQSNVISGKIYVVGGGTSSTNIVANIGPATGRFRTKLYSKLLQRRAQKAPPKPEAAV